MAKLHINLGDAPNDRTGDPLRTAFEKVNANFDELYARTGDDLQIPALAGNNGKVLTVSEGVLSWQLVSSDSVSSIGDFGEGFSLNGANKIVTNKLYSTNLTQPTQHYRLELDTNGVVHLPDQSIINGATLKSVAGNYAGITAGPVGKDEDSWLWVDNNGAWVGTDYSTTAYTWHFDNTGKLTLPGTGTIKNLAGAGSSFTATTGTGVSGDTKEFTKGGDADTVTTSWTATGGGIVGTANITNVNIGLSFTFITFDQSFTATGPITFSGPGGASSLELTPDGTTAWAFSSDGTLSSPNGLLQRNTAPVNCPGNNSTVVYTVSGQYQHTIKLLIQVEGIEGVGSIMDTQACEMIIAKSFRANDIAASVYGIVYTSQAPLATFTADWNALTSRIEVLCTTPGANSVNVKILATEISTSD